MSYQKLDGMNQSLLKQILNHPQNFLRTKERFEQQLQNKEDGVIESVAPHFLFGKVVDFMLTEDTEFEDVFYVCKNIKSPSDTIVALLNMLFNEYVSSGSLESHQGRIIECAARLQYGQNWKAETLFNKVLESGSEYWEMLLESSNKIMVSQEDYNKAVIACAALRSNEYTGYYLNKTRDVEIIKKPVVEFKFKGIDFKGELDLVTIDHELKEITPVDVKTMSGEVNKFAGNFWSYRYDFQGAFYDKGIRVHPEVKGLLETGYKLKPFVFLVVEKESINQPMVYEMSEDVLIKGAVGNPDRNLEGVLKAIERYKWHTENNKWDYPMEYYLSNGKMIIE